MLTFKQFIIESDKFTGRYVFHETHIDSAINIIKQGSIKGLWIAHPDAKESMLDDDEDMEDDYGNYVYASTFSQDHTDFTYYGVADNHVMFVIDVQKLIQEGIFIAKYENGLYKIPTEVPLDAVVYVLIGGYDDEEEDDRLHMISGALMQRGIEFDWSEEEHSKKRKDLIHRFRNNR